MRIKAFAVLSKGGKPEPFYYEKDIGRNDVLVNITHCSIAKGDLQIIRNDWGDTKFPVVPGHEVVGIIEATGDAVTDLEPGDRVGVGYQLSACFECGYCLEGNEQFCQQQQVVGVDSYGGLAEKMIVDHRFAFRIPAGLDSAKVTPLMSSGLTVYTAIVRANLEPCSVVGVSGIGGLGLIALGFLQKMGHRVSAFSHSSDKRSLMENLAINFIDSSDPQQMATYTRRFDFILSTVNAQYDLDQYLTMLRPQGKFCLVSQPLEKMQTRLGLLYDYAQRSIYGNYIGSRKNMIDMLSFAATHRFETMIELLPFPNIDKAIEKVSTSKLPTRVVLVRE